jgi:hypothetical protein
MNHGGVCVFCIEREMAKVLGLFQIVLLTDQQQKLTDSGDKELILAR